VGIADCSNVSRGLSELLDADDPIEGAYDLEVSTPGIERVLRKPWHFQRVIGKKIQTRLQKPLEDFGIQNKKFSAMKQVSETLAAVSDEGIEFRLEEEVAKIPFSAIDRAKVLFDMEPKGEKKTEKKKKKK
jgi:ribosome maturation factor RimP